METFIRDDGRAIPVVRGFRERVLSYRPSVSPRAHWEADDFARAAATRLRRARGRISELELDGRALDRKQILEVGCGAGIESLVTAMGPVDGLTGIDLELPLFASTAKGELTRRLAREVLRQAGLDGDLDDIVQQLPIRFAVMDVTALEFADDSFDVVVTRSAMEHVKPIESALAEMARVAKPGALVHHAIDPYYWVRGCHKRGVVDIPWAHARLSLDEFRRFVRETEGEARATERTRRLETLNRLTITQWRSMFEASPFEIVAWTEDRSPFAEEVLAEHREALEDRLEGLDLQDLVCSRIKVWLRA